MLIAAWGMGLRILPGSDLAKFLDEVAAPKADDSSAAAEELLADEDEAIEEALVTNAPMELL